MGFEEEPEPKFVEKATFRPVCIQLLLTGQSVKSLRERLKKIENQSMFFIEMMKVLQSNEYQESLMMIYFEFKKDDKFNTVAFLNRLEAEMNKVF